MSIIERMKRILQANVHEALEKAEDPGKMLKQRVRELEAAIRAARESLATFAVTFKKSEKEQEQQKLLKVEWQQKAESAVKLGDEDSAKRALAEKLKAEERVRALEPALVRSRATYQNLMDGLHALQDQLSAAKLRQSELQSRQQAAVAQKTFGASAERAAGVGVEGEDFSRMEEQVLQTEAEVEIDHELRGNPGGPYADLESKSRGLQVDAELAALKKRMKR